MKSKTKAHLSDEQVRKVVAAAFGTHRDVTVVELTDGMFNSVYSISTAERDEPIVLKVSAAPDTPVLTYEKDIMSTEIAMLELLAERTTLPVPRVLAHDLSRTQLSSQYFFMTAVDGQTLRTSGRKLGSAGRAAIGRQLGDALAQTHAIRGESFGYPGWGDTALTASWSAAFTRMVNDILSDAVAHQVKLPADRIQDAVARHADVLDEINEPRLVNFDMWSGNVFVTSAGATPHVSGIIDIERCFWGDPLADFVGMNPGKSKPFKDASVWAAYAAGRPDEVSPAGPSREDKIRSGLYQLYIWLLLATETYRYDSPHRFAGRELARLFVRRLLKRIEGGLGPAV